MDTNTNICNIHKINMKYRDNSCWCFAMSKSEYNELPKDEQECCCGYYCSECENEITNQEKIYNNQYHVKIQKHFCIIIIEFAVIMLIGFLIGSIPKYSNELFKIKVIT